MEAPGHVPSVPSPKSGPGLVVKKCVHTLGACQDRILRTYHPC